MNEFKDGNDLGGWRFSKKKKLQSLSLFNFTYLVVVGYRRLRGAAQKDVK